MVVVHTPYRTRYINVVFSIVDVVNRGWRMKEFNKKKVKFDKIKTLYKFNLSIKLL